MKRRSVAATLAVLLVSLAALIGFQPTPAFALGSCTVVPHCYAEDIWYLANGVGVDGGQVKMRVCSLGTVLDTTDTFWADLTDGERVQGGINLLSNGGIEFYAAMVNSAGASTTIHSNADGITALTNHDYYVQILQEGLIGGSPYWDVKFFDATTLAQIWVTVSFGMDSSTANARALRTGDSTTNGFGVAYSSESELQFMRTDRTWASNWDTPTNPGTYTGFYYGDTTANGAAAWHVGYSSLKTALNHTLGCLA